MKMFVKFACSLSLLGEIKCMYVMHMNLIDLYMRLYGVYQVFISREAVYQALL